MFQAAGHGWEAAEGHESPRRIMTFCPTLNAYLTNPN